MKYYNILLIALFLSSCDVSTFSNTDTIDLAKLKVTINIQNDIKKNTLNYLKVKLSDEKKQIINKNISILLNGLPLDLHVKQDLYYTKTSYYKTDSIIKSDAFYFEIILPDSTRYPLAFVKPTPKNEAAKFSIPDNIAIQKDVVLKWEQLNNPHQLEIIKEKKYKIAKNIIEYGYAVKPLDTLKNRIGEYVISKLYLKESLSTVKHFSLLLSRKETGLTNPNLLKNSSITYHHIIEKIIVIKQ